MAFSYEIMDFYGRFLCFLHQHLPPEEREGRVSYNEEMHQSGRALPYFIFPNISPFRKSTILEAIPKPQDFIRKIVEDDKLAPARQWVKEARDTGSGVFQDEKSLSLEPFELRYLARRSPPSRWVIDMEATEPTLMRPTDYYKISNQEDRLFINPEHVPLFRDKEYVVEL